MLTELEELVSSLFDMKHCQDNMQLFGRASEVRTKLYREQYPVKLNEMIERWDKRLSLVQTSHRYLEPILNFRR